MADKKDIGKAFREQLDKLDMTPGNHVWNSIEADLDKKKRRRILPFWLWFSSITSGIIVMLFLANANGYMKVFPNSDDEGNDPTDREMRRQNHSKVENTYQIDSLSNIKQNSVAGETPDTLGDEGSEHKQESEGKTTNRKTRAGHSNKRFELSNNKSGAAKTRDEHLMQHKNGRRNNKSGYTSKANSNSTAGKKMDTDMAKDAVFGGSSTVQSGNTETNVGPAVDKTVVGSTAVDSVIKKDSLPKQQIATRKKKTEPKKEESDSTKVETEEMRTFAVFLYVAPTYTNFFSDESLLDRSLDSLQRTSEVVYNYGGYLCFNYDDKWSFRFGIAKTVLKFRTNEIYINGEDMAFPPGNFYNVQYSPGITNDYLADQFSNSFTMDVEQQFSYLEFPIELKYSIYKRAISFEGIAGFSTLFLKENNVTAYGENGGSIVMGSTKKINEAHFSANLGVGMSYSFLPNFKLNVEPMFKYRFRTAESNAKPYSIAVQTGVEYTFHSKKKKFQKIQK